MINQKKENCYGCKYFFVTYKKSKPYGCKAYGFISKKNPTQVVFQSSGIKCAYKKVENRIL